jgi:hypothetical protein
MQMSMKDETHEHGPGTLVVVIREVVVDILHEIEQEIPRVPRDRLVMLLLEGRASRMESSRVCARLIPGLP